MWSMKDLHYKFTCRLFTDTKCFGPGIARLLHAVDRLHSLRSAALEMEMAYSKAWTIIRNSEEALGFKLLTSSTGGKGGGGAALTPDAVRLLDAYEHFCRAVEQYGDSLFCEHFGYLQNTSK